VVLGLLPRAGHPQRTRGIWIDTYVLADQAHKWCLDSSSVLGKPLCPRGAWGVCLGAGYPQRTCDGWGVLGVSHACTPPGDTWSLGHDAGLEVLRS